MILLVLSRIFRFFIFDSYTWLLISCKLKILSSITFKKIFFRELYIFFQTKNVANYVKILFILEFDKYAYLKFSILFIPAGQQLVSPLVLPLAADSIRIQPLTTQISSESNPLRVQLILSGMLTILL